MLDHKSLGPWPMAYWIMFKVWRYCTSLVWFRVLLMRHVDWGENCLGNCKEQICNQQARFWPHLWTSLLLQHSKQWVQDVWPNCWPLLQSRFKSHSMDPSLSQARWTSAVGFERCQYWHVLSWLVFQSALDAPYYLSWKLLRHVQRTDA